MDALKAVASEPRRRILQLVWGRELSAGEVAGHFDISWPAVSQHLGVLREAGLVRQRREGRRLLYAADPASAGPLAAVLEQLWSDDLDRLAALAEEEER